MPKNKKSLAETHPEIAKDWHPTKNGELTPRDLTPGSNKKVWWKCNKGDDHEWCVSPNNRVRSKSGCPFCSGRYPSKGNNLKECFPKIAMEWHPVKNGKLLPENVTPVSGKKIWWMCSKNNNHQWNAMVGKRTTENEKTGCPYCSGRKFLEGESFGDLYPKIAKEWHPTKNGTKTPFNFSVKNGYSAFWKCDKGDDHIWKTSIYHRVHSKSGCPYCDGQRVDLKHTLRYLYPSIADEIHPTRNGKLIEKNIGVGYTKKIWWQCKIDKSHQWKSSPNSRFKQTHFTGCPFCDLTPQSKQELIITFELSKLFKKIDPKGFKTRLDGRLRAIDIFIPKLNLCIEFDGNYWHKNKRDLDKIKSEMLLDEGFKLIRVREEPLKKIYDTDVISKKPYNGKQVTKNILSVILSMFDLDAKAVSRIKEYQSKDDLQNEKGLDKYIDQILTEKAK